MLTLFATFAVVADANVDANADADAEMRTRTRTPTRLSLFVLRLQKLITISWFTKLAANGAPFFLAIPFLLLSALGLSCCGQLEEGAWNSGHGFSYLFSTLQRVSKRKRVCVSWELFMADCWGAAWWLYMTADFFEMAQIIIGIQINSLSFVFSSNFGLLWALTLKM